MGHRLDIKRIIQSNFVRDLPMVVLGCAIAAFATDMFMIPNGLAAGGVTGVATIIQELGARNGLTLPVGIQTIVINAVLLLAVARAGGLLYVIQTVTGFVLLGVFTDLFAPFVTPLGGEELMLSALWGALACGLGYGLVLRCGSNTVVAGGRYHHGHRRYRLRAFDSRVLAHQCALRCARHGAYGYRGRCRGRRRQQAPHGFCHFR